MTSALFATTALFAAAYLVIPKRANTILRAAIKTVPVTLLAIIAAIEHLPSLLIAALILCALGDWLLAFAKPAETDSSGLDIAFLSGLLAFLAGHLLYVALFLQTSIDQPGPFVWLVAAAIVIFALYMGQRLFAAAGPLRWPVAAYVSAILAMGLTALTTGSWLLVLGATLFMASDAILGAERFLIATDDHRRRAITGPAIWMLYIAAQITILIAFL